MTGTAASGGATVPAPPPDAAPEVESGSDRRPPFAHHSEAELARILDFYEVRWEYEPHVYPILWSLDGAVQESFAPDFYLPDLDLYVELTTLRQRLVRKKNRKLRRLRELYPDVRIKLFYERDFRALMLKYGKLAIADELSGTVGQVGAGRPPAVDGPTDAVAGPTDAASTTAMVTATAQPTMPPPAPRPGVPGPRQAVAGPTDVTSPAPSPTRRTRRTHEATTR